MLANEDAFTHTLFGTKIMVKGFFTSVLEAPALNMGVFVGIIAGFVGAMAYNKYYNYRKLPDALSMESALFRLLLSYGQQSWH